MIYIFWQILNILLVLALLCLLVEFIFKGLKIFEGRLKYVYMTVFLFAIIFGGGAASDKEDKYNRLSFSKQDNSKVSTMESVLLEGNPFFDINLNLIFQDGDIISASSDMTGLMCGYEWRFDGMNINDPKPGVKQFTAYGHLKWELLGCTLYSESKEYTRIIKINE